MDRINYPFTVEKSYKILINNLSIKFKLKLLVAYTKHLIPWVLISRFPLLI